MVVFWKELEVCWRKELEVCWRKELEMCWRKELEVCWNSRKWRCDLSLSGVGSDPADQIQQVIGSDPADLIQQVIGHSSESGMMLGSVPRRKVDWMWVVEVGLTHLKGHRGGHAAFSIRRVILYLTTVKWSICEKSALCIH